MSVSVLIICHHAIGTAMIETISTTLGGNIPLPLDAFSISSDTDPDVVKPEIQQAISDLDQGDGVLILTDLFGSTPCNLANQLESNSKINVVTGLNLPMLVRVMNYPDQDLDQLTETARQGGQEGIVTCDKSYSSGGEVEAVLFQ